MPIRTDSNVFGLTTALQGFLFDMWRDSNFNGGVAQLGREMPLIGVTDAAKFTPTPDNYDQTIDYELLERRGNLALYRINAWSIISYTPNPTGDVGPDGACGLYDDAFGDTYTVGDAFIGSGWGCEPFCSAGPWVWSLQPGLFFVTVSVPSVDRRVRSLGPEYVITVQNVVLGEFTNGKIWAACLAEMPYDEVSLTRDNFSDAVNFDGTMLENYQYAEEGAA